MPMTPSDHQCVDAEVKAAIPYLPPEIKQIVAEHLPKSVLKILRYVSREWNFIATPFLFDRVYISAYEMDFDIFNHITQTPSLANSVKEVICDLSQLVPIDYDTYLIMLQLEIKSIARPDQSIAFHSSNRQLNRFVNGFTRDGQTLHELKSQYGQLLVDGYSMRNQLDEQVYCITRYSSQQPFDDALRAGLRRLPRLEAITMDNAIWERHRRTTSTASVRGNPPTQMQPYDILGVAESGSPLSRSWNPWCLRPDSQVVCSEEDEIPWPLKNIVQALVATNTRIKKFEFWQPLHECLRLEMFRTRAIMDDFPRWTRFAFANLEHLDLQVSPSMTDFPRLDPTRAVGFLPDLLESMVKLKILSLNLESDMRQDQRREGSKYVLFEQSLTFTQVFSPDAIYPRLEYFHLTGLAIHTDNLVVLLHVQMPRLKRLSLGRIELLDGDWDAVVEVMRRVGGWEKCCLEGPFSHKKYQWWPPITGKKEEGDSSALGLYMRYICEGGRHPSLAPGVRDEEARRYIEPDGVVESIISFRQYYFW
ncbi:MAG: hypothetical protein Q9212_007279 [Teloschistes hypoglaucus]